MSKLKCFIISSIGKAGTDIRRDADDLLKMIIKPVLGRYGFEVIRGDHNKEPNRIDEDVIRNVQEADLCICDISLANANVYYELGRRDETGKPVILLKNKQAEEIPVDIRTRRYIEYDLDDRRGIIEATEELERCIQVMMDRGFDETGRAASLVEIAGILQRVERKIDRMYGGGTAKPAFSSATDGGTMDVDPLKRFVVALQQGNIPLAEEAMEQLSYRMDRMKFFDKIVEPLAAIGSKKAGELLIANAQEFFDSDASFSNKMDYLGCLVNYVNRADCQMEIVGLVENITDYLKWDSTEENPDDVIQIYNQRNRLYFGIYATTEEVEWLDKAIGELEKAYKISPKNFICYNLALCLTEKDDYQSAQKYIEECLGNSKTHDAEHLRLACKIFHELNDPRFDDTFELLEKESPIDAMLVKASLK